MGVVYEIKSFEEKLIGKQVSIVSTCGSQTHDPWPPFQRLSTLVAPLLFNNNTLFRFYQVSITYFDRQV